MVSIFFFGFILVNMTRPLRLVTLQTLLKKSQIGKDLADSDETRFDNEIYEPDLTLRDVRSHAVEELTDGELVLLLQITLLEEFHEDEIGPELAQVPWL